MVAQPLSNPDTAALLNIMTRVADRSLFYWIKRLPQTTDYTVNRRAPYSPEVVKEIMKHQDRLVNLIASTTSLNGIHTRAAELLLLIAPVFMAHGYPAHWPHLVRRLAVNMYDPEVNDPVLVGKLWQVVGSHLRDEGDMKRARQAFHMAEELAQGRHEPGNDLYREMLKEQAAIRALQNDFDTALDTANKLLAEAQYWEDKYTVAQGHNLLAFTYLQAHQYRNAFTHAQQALVIWVHLDHHEAATQSLHYMGEAARFSRSFTAARRCLSRAQCCVAEMQKPGWDAMLKQSLGAVELEEANYDRAIAWIKEAKATFQQTHDHLNEVNSTQALGVACTRAGDYAQAAPLLQEAAAAWREMGHMWQYAHTCYALGRTQARLNQPNAAHHSFTAAREAASKFNTDEAQHLIADIDEELDTLQKD